MEQMSIYPRDKKRFSINLYNKNLFKIYTYEKGYYFRNDATVRQCRIR